MNSRYFTNLIGMNHQYWLSFLFGFNITSRQGIDLTDNNIGIEIKSRYKKYACRWTVHDYQISQFRNENPEKELFWAFILYDLSKEPWKMRIRELASCVSSRQAWFLNWDWILKFPVSNARTGPYRYVGKRDLMAENLRAFNRKGGMLYVPANSVLEKRLLV